MKTLLIIVNDVNNSNDYMEYVTELAKDMGTNMHLMYVESPEAYPMGTPGTFGTEAAYVQGNIDERMKMAGDILKKRVKEMKGNLPENISIDSSTELGVTKYIAEKYIANNKADMVVLEGNGHDGFWSQNSTTMEIVRHMDCPVWIVPQNSHYQPFDEIVYATDYHKDDPRALKKTLELTKQYKPHITALHITDKVEFEEKVKKEGFLQVLQKETGYDKISVKTLVDKSKDDVAKLINDFSLHIDAKLIVALKENKHFLDRVFKSGMTQDIVNKAQLPILVYHEKN